MPLRPGPATRSLPPPDGPDRVGADLRVRVKIWLRRQALPICSRRHARARPTRQQPARRGAGNRPLAERRPRAHSAPPAACAGPALRAPPARSARPARPGAARAPHRRIRSRVFLAWPWLAQRFNAGTWAEKISANRLRDARDQAALRAAGWRVETVWECQIDDGALKTLNLQASRPACRRSGATLSRSARTKPIRRRCRAPCRT